MFDMAIALKPTQFMEPTKPPEHGSSPPNETPLGIIRICDFTGQLAGAGVTKLHDQRTVRHRRLSRA